MHVSTQLKAPVAEMAQAGPEGRLVGAAGVVGVLAVIGVANPGGFVLVDEVLGQTRYAAILAGLLLAAACVVARSRGVWRTDRLVFRRLIAGLCIVGSLCSLAVVGPRFEAERIASPDGRFDLVVQSRWSFIGDEHTLSLRTRDGLAARELTVFGCVNDDIEQFDGVKWTGADTATVTIGLGDGRQRRVVVTFDAEGQPDRLVERSWSCPMVRSPL
jgi:hypothetical protein